MTPDKNQSAANQADQQTTERVSNPNISQHRPDWIIPDKETHSNTSNKKDEQQQDNSNTSTGNDETLGIP